jgi:hypothetical protein
MPVIATFAAASARGFGTGSDNRFFYEIIGYSSTSTALFTFAGSDWKPSENFAYYGMLVGTQSTGRTFSSVTFDGSPGYLNIGGQDNSSGEAKVLGLGSLSLGQSPSDQSGLLNVASGGLSSRSNFLFRVIGGYSQPTVHYSSIISHGSFPYTYNIPDCKIGDIVFLCAAVRTSGSGTSNASATNMTLYRQGGPGNNGMTVYAAYVTTDGTFTTTITCTNQYQQWIWGIVVLRAS